MNNKKIFLTGATGFLGSHITRKLIKSGHCLILSCRDKSDFRRCMDFKDSVEWVNLSTPNWISDIKRFKPEIIANIAWEGVESGVRTDWNIQLQNLFFQQELLNLAGKIKLKTFIGFGSQAEYGDIDHPLEETDPTNATTAYGAIKLAASQIVKSFCEAYNINWIWLRLFSFFGEDESEQWLIPSAVKMFKENNPLAFTAGEQEVAYLYVEDLAEIVKRIVEIEMKSGIYNISGNQLISIKKLVTKIRDLVNPTYELKFGTIPYRENQPMKTIGNIDKLENEIMLPVFNNIEDNLEKTIMYYLNSKQ
jgi:nucleoside-diphosphate-sugar epimerase